MNTTHRAPRPRVNLPPLPTEIWLNILARACSAGDWNPLGLHSVVDFSCSSARQRKKIFKESLVTKRYVVRVCKQWNTWASPYLYENLYLGRSKCLRSLHDALFKACDSEGANVVKPNILGLWIKRLDIALRENLSVQDMDARDENITLISGIVQCLPNLTIVFFRNHHSSLGSLSPILWNLANTCGSTLQAVVWDCRVPSPAPNVWRAFLQKAIHIRILHCPQHLHANEFEVLPPLLPFLEFLHAYEHPLFSHFPSLRHLVVDVLEVQTGWKPFLKVNGVKLEVVQLNIYISRYCLTIMSLLVVFCPNLVRLDISASDWDLIPFRIDDFELELPPKVHTLGLQNTAIQAPSQMYGLLFSGLEEMKLTSSLSCIQLIDAGNVRDLTRKHRRILIRGIEMLKRKGLELRDHED
ncbi:hypothetical protein E4T56_gene8143 [Termitomyces sp. T112]|nr:hypothetical protein E4T56_gene8143 [Termitomyces sp. T112]